MNLVIFKTCELLVIHVVNSSIVEIDLKILTFLKKYIMMTFYNKEVKFNIAKI